MFTYESVILIVTAASIALIHTLTGPDHYLPLIVLSRSEKWSISKTGWLTAFCGIGHILSAVLLGIAAVSLGLAITKLQSLEYFRNVFSTWALIAFGFLYFAYGLRRARKSFQSDCSNEKAVQCSPWVLFSIFLLGPCDPLIPLMLYPAARGNLIGTAWVTAVFAGVTILTMLSVVLVSVFGLIQIPKNSLARYSHVFAGAVIFFCGITIKFFGL